MKGLWKVVLVVIIIVILFFGGGIFYLTRGLSSGANITLKGLDLVDIRDGIYTGVYEAGRWTNEVQVEIENHQIMHITVIKDVVFSKPEWRDELLTRVIAKQDTDIDVITGGTVSCNAYLKAIEDALQLKQ